MSRREPSEPKPGPRDGLTPREARLVSALIEGCTLTDAAAEARVSLATAKRWMQRATVRDALRSAQHELFADLGRRLGSTDAAAVEVLVELMRSRATPAATRRAAADRLLTHRARVYALTELADRISALEASDEGGTVQ